MISVIVSYTVKPDFVDRNIQNINIFLNDFRKMDSNNFSYKVLLKDDKRTFVHLGEFADKEIQQQVLEVASFKAFQAERDASGLDGTHKVEMLTHIGATTDTL